MIASFFNHRLWQGKRKVSATQLISSFLQLQEHHWIAADRLLLQRVANFLCLIPEDDLHLVLEKKRLLLLYCNQKMSAAFHQYEGREIVLLFPELLTLLRSPEYLQGFAVLAHELGHIVHGHSQKKISPIQAQLEADEYARELGFQEELSAVLRVEAPCHEVQERLSRLKLR